MCQDVPTHFKYFNTDYEFYCVRDDWSVKPFSLFFIVCVDINKLHSRRDLIISVNYSYCSPPFDTHLELFGHVIRQTIIYRKTEKLKSLK